MTTQFIKIYQFFISNFFFGESMGGITITLTLLNEFFFQF
jgi:hypothetical protein